MLKAILRSQYRSRNSGQKVFVYGVTGSPAELEQYKTAQGTNLREVAAPAPDAGTLLFFVTEFDADGVRRLIQKTMILTITTNNKVVVDDLIDKIARDQRVSLAQEAEEGKLRAQVSVFRTVRAPVAAPVPAPVPAPASADALLDMSFETAHIGAGADDL